MRKRANEAATNSIQPSTPEPTPVEESRDPDGPLKPSEETKLDLIRGAHSKESAQLIAADGDTITITKGREVFQPMAFHSFEVGPLGMTVRVREGEDFGRAYMRASVALEELFEAEFQCKVKSFRDHVAHARIR